MSLKLNNLKTTGKKIMSDTIFGFCLGITFTVCITFFFMEETIPYKQGYEACTEEKSK